MSQEETALIDDVIAFVRLSAQERHPWLADIREPTEDEVKKVELFCQRFPTVDQAIDTTPTKVLL